MLQEVLTLQGVLTGSGPGTGGLQTLFKQLTVERDEQSQLSAFFPPRDFRLTRATLLALRAGPLQLVRLDPFTFASADLVRNKSHASHRSIEGATAVGLS